MLPVQNSRFDPGEGAETPHIKGDGKKIKNKRCDNLNTLLQLNSAWGQLQL